MYKLISWLISIVCYFIFLCLYVSITFGINGYSLIFKSKGYSFMALFWILWFIHIYIWIFHYWFNSLFWLVALDKYVRESVGDGSTDESSDASPGFLDGFAPAGSRVSASALWTKQELTGPSYPPLIFPVRRLPLDGEWFFDGFEFKPRFQVAVVLLIIHRFTIRVKICSI